MKVPVLVVLLVTLAGVVPAGAQYAVQGQKLDEPHGGIGLSYYMPKGELKESHDSGYGVSLIFAYPASDHMDITGNAAWSRYKINEQPENALRGSEDFTVWEFTSGVRFRFKMVYVGAEFGYFTNFDEWGLVPNAGLRWRIFDLGYRVKMGDETEVHSIRAGVYF